MLSFIPWLDFSFPKYTFKIVLKKLLLLECDFLIICCSSSSRTSRAKSTEQWPVLIFCQIKRVPFQINGHRNTRNTKRYKKQILIAYLWAAIFCHIKACARFQINDQTDHRLPMRDGCYGQI